MSTVADLMGLGMPAALAARLGNTPTSITAAGTSQSTATLITQHVAMVNAQSSQTGAVFSSNASLGAPFFVVSPVGVSAATAVIYCPVSGTMNGSTNGSVLLTTGKTAIFTQTAALAWVSFPLAP